MYELKVVRERRVGYGRARDSAKTSAEVFRAFHRHYDRLDREQFIVLLLDGQNQVLGFHVVSTGSLTQSLVDPGKVFTAVLLANAAALICIHGHPSGGCEPSPEDIAITERLRQAGELMNRRVLDHIVIGDGRYYSFADQGRMGRC